MSKIVENLHVFSFRALKKASLLRKIAATGVLSAIIVGLCGSNLAFAEIGGGTRILTTLAILHDK